MVNKTSLFLTALSLAISTGVIVPVSSPAIADSTNLVSQSWTHRQSASRGRLRFPVRGVRPTRSMLGGIARGGACSQPGNASTPSLQLTALLPKLNPPTTRNPRIEIESTVAAHPTIFIYVPANQPEQGEFILSGENDDPLYRANIPLRPEGGVIGVRIPTDVAELEVGRTYHWSLTLICDPEGADRSGDPLVEGWLQRIELDAAQSQQLNRTTPRDRPSFYANLGIWSDTLASLAELRLTSPNDRVLAQDWADLLASVQLQAIAQAPLLDIRTEPPIPLEDF